MNEELTKEEALKIHKALWTWLSENPDRLKREWPEWELNGGEIIWCTNSCPACEYNDQNFGEYCGLKCIIAWPAGYSCQWIDDVGLSNSSYEIYNQWYYSEDPAVRASLAAQIANLPLRKET